MPVQEIFWFIFLHQKTEYRKSLMRQIHPIIELVRRSVGDQYIKSLIAPQFPPELAHAAVHLGIRILVISRAVAHGTTKPQNPHSFVHEYIIFDTDTALRRFYFIFFVVIAMHIQNRDIGQCHQKHQIIRIQITARYNQINIF